MRYKLRKFARKPGRLPKRLLWLVAALIVVIVAGTFISRHAYNNGIKPVSTSQKTQIFTVEKGSAVKEIGANLEKAHLIRSAWAFQLYVHNKELSKKLQAGTYAFSPSDGVEGIVSIMTKGRVSTQLVTIVPGRRIDQVRADLINIGFTPSDVDRALKPAQYADLPALAYKPADVDSLEGLLWPDSWYKDANSSASHIIRQSLMAMGDHLTPDVQAAFAAQGLTVYQGLTLASVVLQEVSRPADQSQAAQVFMSRLKSGSKLESDASNKYGAVLSGRPPSLTYDSPYNTYNHPGLPPTPISTVNATALEAAAHPANTNWLYFVAGDDGTTYFATNLKDHEANTQKYCHQLCGN